MFRLSLNICLMALNLPKVYFEFFPNLCCVKYQTSKEILVAGRVKNGLYVFYDFTLLPSSKPQSVSSSIASCESSTSSFHNDVSSSFQCKLESCNITNQDYHVSLNSLDLWHYKLKHSSLKIVKSIMSNCNIYGPIKMEFPSTRSDCCHGKIHKFTFSSSNTIYAQPLQLIHFNLWGSSLFQSFSGSHYCIHFVDAYLKFSQIYFAQI